MALPGFVLPLQSRSSFDERIEAPVPSLMRTFVSTRDTVVDSANGEPPNDETHRRVRTRGKVLQVDRAEAFRRDSCAKLANDVASETVVRGDVVGADAVLRAVAAAVFPDANVIHEVL